MKLMHPFKSYRSETKSDNADDDEADSHDPYVLTMLRRQHIKGNLSNENDNFPFEMSSRKDHTNKLEHLSKTYIVYGHYL